MNTQGQYGTISPIMELSSDRKQALSIWRKGNEDFATSNELALATLGIVQREFGRLLPQAHVSNDRLDKFMISIFEGDTGEINHSISRVLRYWPKNAEVAMRQKIVEIAQYMNLINSRKSPNLGESDLLFTPAYQIAYFITQRLHRGVKTYKFHINRVKDSVSDGAMGLLN